MTRLSDPARGAEEQAGIALAVRRRRQRSLALLVVLLALSGVFYAISIVRIGDLAALRSAGRPAAAP